MDKVSFILYTEYADDFALLSDEEAGTLIKAIFLYTKEGVTTDFEDRLLTMLYSHIITAIERNSEKWEETKEKRSEAGRLGGAPKGNSNASKNKQNNQKQPMLDLVDLKQAKQTETSKNNQNQAKQTKQAVNVNVNDNVNVSVNDSVNDSVNVTPEESGVIHNADVEIKLKEIQKAYALNLTHNQEKRIVSNLKQNNLDPNFLSYVAEYIRATYSNVTSPAFYKAVLEWDNLKANFREIEYLPDKNKESGKPSKMSACPYCGQEIEYESEFVAVCNNCMSAFNYDTRTRAWKVA